MRPHHGVHVIQPVSYIPCSLAFTFVLYRSSQSKIFLLLLKLASESPLTSSFLFNSPSVPPSLPSIYRTLYRALSDTSSHMHLYTYVGVRVAPFSIHTVFENDIHGLQSCTSNTRSKCCLSNRACFKFKWYIGIEDWCCQGDRPRHTIL